MAKDVNFSDVLEGLVDQDPLTCTSHVLLKGGLILKTCTRLVTPHTKDNPVTGYSWSRRDSLIRHNTIQGYSCPKSSTKGLTNTNVSSVGWHGEAVTAKLQQLLRDLRWPVLCNTIELFLPNVSTVVKALRFDLTCNPHKRANHFFRNLGTGGGCQSHSGGRKGGSCLHKLFQILSVHHHLTLLTHAPRNQRADDESRRQLMAQDDGEQREQIQDGESEAKSSKPRLRSGKFQTPSPRKGLKGKEGGSSCHSERGTKIQPTSPWPPDRNLPTYQTTCDLRGQRSNRSWLFQDIYTY